jgi:hypothetical protein
MDATKSYIKIYNMSPEAVNDFEFDYSVDDTDLLTELVPNLDQWGDTGWVELEEYEYLPEQQVITLTLDTKWDAPLRWLQQASADSVYFENKLITMTTIQKDETTVTGVAIMDGEVLQDKQIWDMSSEVVAKYYDDSEPQYDLDDLDNQIWDSIAQFLSVCEKFYGNEPAE